ncbi:hypothetical protein [Alcanivorax quisquiliarum]|uniref:MSHA biogenesis protein MshQ n=1 Tax=Alcanivorax quisquiliarum TaxID=2933565 RepID=A0ABT0E997_9GAMM|nr:hypothetical protein [Alcanivorax quisquiliarum]MCK0538335.1 hypothetical protein [Alcanivorax quisquiliarum]
MANKIKVVAFGVTLLASTQAFSFTGIEYQTGSSTYSAAPVGVFVGDNSGTTPFGPNAVGAAFSGSSQLTFNSPLINLDATCELWLLGQAAIDANGRGYIDVTDGYIGAGSSACSDIRLEGFDWQAYESGTLNLGIPGTMVDPDNDIIGGDFRIVQVRYTPLNLIICSGVVPATFANGDGSRTDNSWFNFNTSMSSPVPFASCDINGRVFSEPNYDMNVL